MKSFRIITIQSIIVASVAEFLIPSLALAGACDDYALAIGLNFGAIITEPLRIKCERYGNIPSGRSKEDIEKRAKEGQDFIRSFYDSNIKAQQEEELKRVRERQLEAEEKRQRQSLMDQYFPR